MVEVIGYVASLLVLVSLLQASILRLRWINLVGSLVFTAYGVLIEAWPVALVNFSIALINVYYLRQLLGPEPSFAVLPVRTDSAYLDRFLEFHARDIGRFVPEFDGLRDDHHAFFVTQDLIPAGVVLARPLADDGTWLIDLDYAIPGDRDFKLGPHLDRRSTRLQDEGARRLVARPTQPAHRRYLERLGFLPEGDQLTLAL